MTVTLASPICPITRMKSVLEPRSLIQVGFVAGDTYITVGELPPPLAGTRFLACGPSVL